MPRGELRVPEEERDEEEIPRNVLNITTTPKDGETDDVTLKLEDVTENSSKPSKIHSEMYIPYAPPPLADNETSVIFPEREYV